ncbi:MAG: helix-turn-helix domain-containing protein [Longispora sp.]|nr:helix-turn-helix domain-containing protein [Longispora sp. (in: high G+C Gram-positive bacteria)]
MAVDHMAMVFLAEGLSGPEKLLLLAMTNHTDPHGYCWPSVERLADYTGTSTATVKRARKSLEEKNLVKRSAPRRNHRGERISNLYRVNLELLASMRAPVRKYDDDLMQELVFDETPAQGLGLNLSPSEIQPVEPQLNMSCGQGLILSPTTAHIEPYVGLNMSPNPSLDPSLDPSSLSARVDEVDEIVVGDLEKAREKRSSRERGNPTASTPAGLVSRYVSNGEDPEWIAAEIIRRYPGQVRSEIGLFRTLDRDGQLAVMVAEICLPSSSANAETAVALDAFLEAVKTAPACDHGTPGGSMINPKHGTPRCPSCRRRALQPSQAS